ncbi:MAG: hypothetical protein HY403_05020 [Elusimicrobia bacterium]|nr:hypothetical protein [Elusimicrobiota bacterium]
MAREACRLILAVALAASWAAPLRAASLEPSHACCAGGEVPMPARPDGQLPACCRAPEVPLLVCAAPLQAPAPALLPFVAAAAEPLLGALAVPARPVPSAPQAPPGTHSGLSPPASGL